MQEYWYSGGSAGTLYLFLTYVEVDLLSWGGRQHPDSQGNSLVSLLENNHRIKAFLDQTGVIVRTNAIGALLQQSVIILCQTNLLQDQYGEAHDINTCLVFAFKSVLSHEVYT
jgi:hypothetical protein